MKRLFLILCLAPSLAYADDPHHEDTGGMTTIENTTIVHKSSSNTEGVALAIAAAQHQFDFGTYSSQASIAAGSYDGNDALSIGAGKRLKDSRALVNGSIGIENGKVGIGAAINWRF